MQIVAHVHIDRECGYQEAVFFLRNIGADGDDGTENHGENVHQDYTGQIVKVKPKGSHAILYISSQHVEKVQEQQAEHAVGGLGEHIGEQPPNLPLKNQGLIKAQQVK